MDRRSAWAILIAGVVVALGGCAAPDASATPPPTMSESPEPARTPSTSPISPASPASEAPLALDDLVLTPDGMNGLAIGQPVPGSLAEWDPLGCRTEANASLYGEYAEDDPIWNAFIPTFPAEPRTKDGYSYEVYPYDVHHDEDRTLSWLRVNSPAIATDRGIRVGSSEAEVLAAYPDAVVVDNGSTGFYRAYSVAGESARLIIEVTFDDFDSPGPRDVWMMRLDPLDWDVRSLGGGDAGGFCALTV